jgi:outer membrane protein TolC
VGAVALVSTAPLPASAQGGPPANPDSALAAALAGIRGEPLALEDAVARALEHATGVREAEAGVRAAAGAHRRESGAFDPVLFADLEVRDESAQTASPFSGANVLETQQRLTNAGARLRLPIGTELEARLSTTRLETNSAFASLNPEYSSQGRLSVRQPLLKGFGPAAGGARAAAERSLDAAKARYSDAELAVEADAVTTYWDLYAAERDLAVQQVIAERAEALLAQARRRAAAGLAGPSEVATARVFLTEQQLAAIDREERLDEVSDRLASLLGGAPVSGTSRWHAETEPPSAVPVEDEEALVGRALARNGEIRAAREDLEALRLQADAARWNAFPSLDLIGSVGGNGLTGDGRAVTFGDTTTSAQDTGRGFGESVSEALRRESPTWSVGVTLEVPLGFRAGRGEWARLRAEAERAEQRVVELERSVREDVRARHRELEHGLRRLELARAGVDASLEQVRIGQIEYANGRTTAFELVRLGADLAAAQERYSSALVRTAQAEAELRRLAPAGEAVPSTPETR